LWQTSHQYTKNWRPKLSQVYVVPPVGLGLAELLARRWSGVEGAALLVASVDLGPALQAAEPGGRTYFVFDGHWTPRGHDVVAEALAPRVSARLDPRER
jgi:hypothetical protein